MISIQQQKKTIQNKIELYFTCGFGFVDVVCDVVVGVVAEDVVGRLLESEAVVWMIDGCDGGDISVKWIGFFVGFGFGRDGNLSHCVGRGFVIKFGCVVTCHCVVCVFGFHNPVVDTISTETEIRSLFWINGLEQMEEDVMIFKK